MVSRSIRRIRGGGTRAVPWPALVAPLCPWERAAGATGRRQRTTTRRQAFPGHRKHNPKRRILSPQLLESERGAHGPRLEFLAAGYWDHGPATVERLYYHDILRDCSESTGLPPEDVYRKVRVRTFEPGGQHDVRSR